jgi:hypothetical protein
MQSQQALARGTKSRPSRVNSDEIDELLALGSTPTRPVKTVEVLEASARPAAQAAPAPASEVPASLTGFFDLYAQYERKVAELADDLRQAERQLLGDDWRTVISTPKTDYLSSIAQGLVDNLVAQAEQRYAPEAGSLKIERYDVLQATGQQRWQAQTPPSFARGLGAQAHNLDSRAFKSGSRYGMAPKNWRPVAASLLHERLKPQAAKLPSPNTTTPARAAKANCQRGRSPLLTGVDWLCDFLCVALCSPASNSSTNAACCAPDCLDIAKATADAFSASLPALRAAPLASSTASRIDVLASSTAPRMDAVACSPADRTTLALKR